MTDDKRTPSLADEKLNGISGGFDSPEIPDIPKRAVRPGDGRGAPIADGKPTEDDSNLSPAVSPAFSPSAPGVYDIKGISWN